MLSRGNLFVLSAPSGAGKTSVAREVLDQLDNIEFSVSHTTRPPRPGEIEGRDYFFVDGAEFQRMIQAGAFLEWARVHGNLYGTSRAWVDERLGKGFDVLLDIDVQGAEQLRDSKTDAVTILLMAPSRNELAKRLEGRATESPDSLARRLDEAGRELGRWSQYDYIIVNRVLTEAVTELESIVLATRCRREVCKTEVEAIVESFSATDSGSING